MAVYFDQLISLIGRYCECHPAYQVKVTISTSVEFPCAGGVGSLAGALDEGVGLTEAAKAGGGVASSHVGAAQTDARLESRTVESNMCNMLEETTQGEVVEREWAEMGVTVWRPDGRWPFCTPVASVPRWGRNGR